ncbi:MAG: haloacid dehalogenase [Actinomycetota bacterium]|nr:haloacid dehalogenase [Actinomycetota bacterium]
MNLDPLARQFQERFDAKSAARERALVAARRAIRSSANAIRAIHRLDRETAHRLMDEARAAIEDGVGAVRDHPDVAFAGFLQDAQKEYVEARITEAVIDDGEFPTPDELGVQLAPYLNGMAEAVGEARRHILDLLRKGEVARSEAMLRSMEDIYSVLVSMDYPDAITGNLRRSTDVARSIMEKTRGDLSMSIVQRDLRDALERHARQFGGGDPGARA